MANDYKLPDGAPETDIVRIKRLSIYMTTDGATPTMDLGFHIQGYTEADENEEGGKLIPAGSAPDRWIDEFLRDDTIRPAISPTPLDFSLQEKCFVVLKLIGNFWEFSNRHDAVTTKNSHADRRYYNLRGHALSNGPVRCVSFCARQPVRKNSGGNHVRHGINLYVDFVQGVNDILRLPVIIDPDIENKGNN